MARKFLTRFIPNRPVQDEVATHLEDTLNDLHNKGYQVNIEQRADGSYMVHGELIDAEPVTEGVAPMVLGPMTMEKLLEFMAAIEDKDPSMTDMDKSSRNEARAFVGSIVHQLSSLTVAAAKKEMPGIVAKLTKGMSVDKIKAIADGCKSCGAGHPKEGECVKCDIYNVTAAVLTESASLNLS